MESPADDGGAGLERRLYALRDQAYERSDQAREIARTLSAVTATADRAAGAVRATVTASGGLLDLALGDAVRGWQPDRIAREVLSCVQQAQARLAEVASNALTDGTLADFTVDRLRGDFPAVTPKPPPPVEDDDVVPELFDSPEPRNRRSWT